MLREKELILSGLETAFNILYSAKDLKTLSPEDRMLVIIQRQSEVINKIIQKQNNLANLVAGPQKPEVTKDGIILL